MTSKLSKSFDMTYPCHITGSLDHRKGRFAIRAEAYEIEGYGQVQDKLLIPILASKFHHGYSEKKNVEMAANYA